MGGDGSTNQFTEAPISGFALKGMEELSSLIQRGIFVLNCYFKHRVDKELRVLLLHGR
jgi:hypothetical protein